MHLYHYAEDHIDEIRSIVQTLMESVAVQQKKIVSEMYNKCSEYVNIGLKRVVQLSKVDSDETQSKIKNCFLEVNGTIDDTTEQYLRIFDESEQMLTTTIEKLQKEPVGDDLDEINDEIDDIIEDFKEILENNINPAVESLLRQIRTASVALPLKVKKCVDEVLH